VILCEPQTGDPTIGVPVVASSTHRRHLQAPQPVRQRQHTVAEIAEAVSVHRTTVCDYLNKER
jgi:hypothetical protein